MNNEVLYRKYRPKNFDEVIGQDHIVKALLGALKQDAIAHAYLFAGSRGIGKTSIARIFAKEIGTSPNDIYEIDAASNRGIDDIRELREAVSTLPFESKYKVYIIDEVHMLTKEAFNALLKTLEEPPRHVVFILATTETDKIPETIVSRCQCFTFTRPSTQVLQEVLTKASKKEGFSIEGSAMELIALLGDGSFRDAYGILQKVIASSGDKKITLKEVETITGAPRTTLVNDFVYAIAKADQVGALTIIKTLEAQNISLTLFVELVVRRVRSILLARYSVEALTEYKETLSKEDLECVTNLASGKEGTVSSETLREVLSVYEEIRKSSFPVVVLELMVMRLKTN